MLQCLSNLVLGLVKTVSYTVHSCEHFSSIQWYRGSSVTNWPSVQWSSPGVSRIFSTVILQSRLQWLISVPASWLPQWSSPQWCHQCHQSPPGWCIQFQCQDGQSPLHGSGTHTGAFRPTQWPMVPDDSAWHQSVRNTVQFRTQALPVETSQCSMRTGSGQSTIGWSCGVHGPQWNQSVSTSVDWGWAAQCPHLWTVCTLAIPCEPVSAVQNGQWTKGSIALSWTTQWCLVVPRWTQSSESWAVPGPRSNESAGQSRHSQRKQSPRLQSGSPLSVISGSPLQSQCSWGEAVTVLEKELPVPSVLPTVRYGGHAPQSGSSGSVNSHGASGAHTPGHTVPQWQSLPAHMQGEECDQCGSTSASPSMPFCSTSAVSVAVHHPVRQEAVPVVAQLQCGKPSVIPSLCHTVLDPQQWLTTCSDSVGSSAAAAVGAVDAVATAAAGAVAVDAIAQCGGGLQSTSPSLCAVVSQTKVAIQWILQTSVSASSKRVIHFWALTMPSNVVQFPKILLFWKKTQCEGFSEVF